MATFPALTPSSRSFTPGVYPATPFTGYSGKRQVIRHSNVFQYAKFDLVFVALTEAEMLQILSHYIGQRGNLDPFIVSSEVLSLIDPAGYFPSDYLWRYAGDGEIEDYSCGGHRVTISIETAAPVTITLPAGRLVLELVLSPGAVLPP